MSALFLPLPIAVVAAIALTAARPTYAAQAGWKAQYEQVKREMQTAVDQARQRGDESVPAGELEALFKKGVAILGRAVAQARTCADRKEVVAEVLSLDRQMQLLGAGELVLPSGEGSSSLLSGSYEAETFEQCMNEMYASCVATDDVSKVFEMTEFVVSTARMRALLGSGADTLLGEGELDPRITKCRGNWYKVRLTFNTEGSTDVGRYKEHDTLEGFIGRGLSTEHYRGRARHPGFFTRRTEVLDNYSRCPDGGCAGNCSYTVTGSGTGELHYGGTDLHDGTPFRSFFVTYQKGQWKNTLAQNACPHTDLPAWDPDGGAPTFTVLMPPDVVTPLTDEMPRPGDLTRLTPREVESFDEWARMFTRGETVELLDEWQKPRGQLTVLTVCDGQELWGKGSAECAAQWQAYLAFAGRAAK